MTSRETATATAQDPQRVDILIVGAGFAGIGLGQRLKKAGLDDFLLLDRAAAVGGTWWWNTYPGCQCDIPSHLYSLSTAPNPDWTRTYPLQPEIRDYLERCADTFGLRPHLRLRRDVTRIAWDQGEQRWHVQTSSGDYSARVVVGAHGGISEPRLPDLPGRESFAGASFHSAAWDHSVDLAGKRVAVLGTGASAIQIVPAIQPDVARLHVFQRTPPWVLPHLDRPVTRFERWLYRRVPALQRLPRAFAYGYRELASPAFTRHTRLLGPLELRARRHMHKQVRDPALREALRPSYRIGCKRVLPSNTWYPALQQHNVDVVTDPVAQITPTGLRTATGRDVDVDVIVYATGFDVTDMPFARRIVGRHGITLDQTWAGSAQAHKNTTVPGFPNLFLVLGLNTGYSSMVYMIESQLNYVVDALATMRDRDVATLDAKPEPFAAWNASVQRRMPRTVWNSGGCSSWYLDRNGRNTTVWPDYTWKFRRQTRTFDIDAYDTAPQPAKEPGPARTATLRSPRPLPRTR